jgi:hypothetical protein
MNPLAADFDPYQTADKYLSADLHVKFRVKGDRRNHNSMQSDVLECVTLQIDPRGRRIARPLLSGNERCVRIGAGGWTVPDDPVCILHTVQDNARAGTAVCTHGGAQLHPQIMDAAQVPVAA